MRVTTVSGNKLSGEGLSRILISEGFSEIRTHSSLDDMLANSPARPEMVLLDLMSQIEQLSLVKTLSKSTPTSSP
jgi:DNA-binding response OmpR family regulator